MSRKVASKWLAVALTGCLWQAANCNVLMQALSSAASIFWFNRNLDDGNDDDCEWYEWPFC